MCILFLRKFQKCNDDCIRAIVLESPFLLHSINYLQLRKTLAVLIFASRYNLNLNKMPQIQISVEFVHVHRISIIIFHKFNHLVKYPKFENLIGLAK